MVVMSSTPSISGRHTHTLILWLRVVLGWVCQEIGPRTMMSYFGHEAIFTLDYAINENQMFDCLMLCQRRSAWVSSMAPEHHPASAPLQKCCNFAKVPAQWDWSGWLLLRWWTFQLFICLFVSSTRLMCARAIRARVCGWVGGWLAWVWVVHTMRGDVR